LTVPGGIPPSPAAFCAEAERAGLRVVEQPASGQDDYAPTWCEWRDAFRVCLPDHYRPLQREHR